MLLVVCWRSEAVPPGHRLRRLAHEGRTTIVSPSRLDEAEVAQLVRSAVELGETPEVERRVFVESEGLPLFVAEYLAALAAGEPVEGVLTDELRGLLDRRLAGLMAEHDRARPRRVSSELAAFRTRVFEEPGL